jgi:hypothetical protein
LAIIATTVVVAQNNKEAVKNSARFLVVMLVDPILCKKGRKIETVLIKSLSLSIQEYPAKVLY